MRAHIHTHTPPPLTLSSFTQTHKQTNALVLIVALFLWGHAQVVLGFFFNNFFSQPRTGIIIGYLLVIAGVVVALLLELLQVGHVITVQSLVITAQSHVISAQSCVITAQSHVILFRVV